MNYLIWRVKAMFCKHKWIYYRSVFGDEINYANGKRVQECCLKCDSLRYVDKPMPKPGEKL